MSESHVSASEEAKTFAFPACLKFDFVAGFLVFLIALPLCLGIAKASGYPAIGGIITAIVGGIMASLISNSELTIKGPAAGLIAIIAGCVRDFGGTFGTDPIADMAAYKIALAVGVAAAVCQIVFGLVKAGKLGDFFPTAAVHGLLASIGVVIMIRQFLLVLGVSAKQPGEATKLLFDYPSLIGQGTDGSDGFNLPIAIIGVASLAILIVYPLLKVKLLKAIPVQLIVLMVAIPLAIFLNVRQPGQADKPAAAVAASGATAAAKAPAVPLLPGHTFTTGETAWPTNPDKFLINVPGNFLNAFVLPDFTIFTSDVFGARWWMAMKWVFMFSVIASLESLLSAKAVDIIDPMKRKCDLNRDLLGCGVANFITSFIGGLPMISEIVRSRANVDAGARTRFANVFHGIFLLLFVALLPFVVKMIPISALAAMLVYTGFRLAHPKEFFHMYKIGVEQIIVFVTTIVVIICTDLLIGALVGMLLELTINLFNGLSLTALFSCSPEVRKQDSNTIVIVPRRSAVFSNWLGLRGVIDNSGLKNRKNVIVDLSRARLVDHTVMERLLELEREFRNAELRLEVVGLDRHRAVSAHPAAARKLAPSM